MACLTRAYIPGTRCFYRMPWKQINLYDTADGCRKAVILWFDTWWYLLTQQVVFLIHYPLSRWIIYIKRYLWGRTICPIQPKANAYGNSGDGDWSRMMLVSCISKHSTNISTLIGSKEADSTTSHTLNIALQCTSAGTETCEGARERICIVIKQTVWLTLPARRLWCTSDVKRMMFDAKKERREAVDLM